jgi:hypothetical protein
MYNIIYYFSNIAVDKILCIDFDLKSIRNLRHTKYIIWFKYYILSMDINKVGTFYLKYLVWIIIKGSILKRIYPFIISILNYKMYISYNQIYHILNRRYHIANMILDLMDPMTGLFCKYKYDCYQEWNYQNKNHIYKAEKCYKFCNMIWCNNFCNY